MRIADTIVANRHAVCGSDSEDELSIVPNLNKRVIHVFAF